MLAISYSRMTTERDYWKAISQCVTLPIKARTPHGPLGLLPRSLLSRMLITLGSNVLPNQVLKSTLEGPCLHSCAKPSGP
jgi:hypothetical protein